MKHPASRDLYTRWQALRRPDGAPAAAACLAAPPQLAAHRFAIADAAGGYVLHHAGTAVRTMIGPDAEGRPFPALFTSRSRLAVTDLLAIVDDEAMPTVAGIAARQGRRAVALELLLLPPNPPGTAKDLAGLLVPLTAGPVVALRSLALVSWRHLHPALPSRALRKIVVAPGIVLYEARR